MKSKINSFDVYLTQLSSDEERALILKLKEIAETYLSNFELTFQYGFPLYSGLGKFGFAIKKNYISIYFHHNEISNYIKMYANQLGNFDFGKDTVRFKNLNDNQIEAIKEIISKMYKS